MTGVLQERLRPFVRAEFHELDVAFHILAAARYYLIICAVGVLYTSLLLSDVEQLFDDPLFCSESCHFR